MMMLEDDDYNESIENIIDSQKVNAEYAVAVTADNFAEMFASMDDPYMQARAADVKDISNRIIANLTGNVSDGSAGDDKMIVCADDLAPSETISLDKDKVLALRYCTWLVKFTYSYPCKKYEHTCGNRRRKQISI